MDRLLQKTIFTKKEINILEKGFTYKNTLLGKESEIFIPFENLTEHKLSEIKAEIGILIASAALYMITLLCLWSYLDGGKDSAEPQDVAMLAFIATSLMVLYWFNRQNVWKIIISNNLPVLLYKTVPDGKTTDSFYNHLITRRNNYLKNNYAIMDRDLSYEDHVKNLKWLKSNGVLSQEEYNNKYEELKNFIYLISPIGNN